MSDITIKSCVCASKYQDEKYGPGLRVFNKSSDGTKMSCTACGKPFNLGGKK